MVIGNNVALLQEPGMLGPLFKFQVGQFHSANPNSPYIFKKTKHSSVPAPCIILLCLKSAASHLIGSCISLVDEIIPVQSLISFGLDSAIYR